MILMTIPHLKIGVSPMVEMLRIKTFPSTLWGMITNFVVEFLPLLKIEAIFEGDPLCDLQIKHVCFDKHFHHSKVSAIV